MISKPTKTPGFVPKSVIFTVDDEHDFINIIRLGGEFDNNSDMVLTTGHRHLIKRILGCLKSALQDRECES